MKENRPVRAPAKPFTIFSDPNIADNHLDASGEHPQGRDVLPGGHQATDCQIRVGPTERFTFGEPLEEGVDQARPQPSRGSGHQDKLRSQIHVSRLPCIKAVLDTAGRYVGRAP